MTPKEVAVREAVQKYLDANMRLQQVMAPHQGRVYIYCPRLSFDVLAYGTDTETPESTGELHAAGCAEREAYTRLVESVEDLYRGRTDAPDLRVMRGITVGCREHPPGKRTPL